MSFVPARGAVNGGNVLMLLRHQAAPLQLGGPSGSDWLSTFGEAFECHANGESAVETNKCVSVTISITISLTNTLTALRSAENGLTGTRTGRARNFLDGT